MIVSFHPCYEADANILCAGRQPDNKDRMAIRSADAVILPQGCPEALYRMARKECAHVFPDYDVRFQYPGKTGQAKLFQACSVSHPQTWVFANTAQFKRCGNVAVDAGFPLVLKLDWGGEGDTVFLLKDVVDLKDALSRVDAYERTGQKGFVLQQFIPASHRTLRVVVIGRTQKAYWRVQKTPFSFGTSVAKGATIDEDSDPVLRQKGIFFVRDFCRQTKINLAGFDLLFDETEPAQKKPQPLLLEINYFFGRTGLGGSEAFYSMLQTQINAWLEARGIGILDESGKRQ